ncbi:hypothetical protein CEXT_617021 [Caerostris extrusa]|uniref:Uncharacterized protein n=1 Tax=Caerostris extrusa TaxID=172846 RepID=A0AAV4XQA9_CAEEX|nr:hypothetical protein CEXT_617021 [Caerostris extrusa]
MFLSHFSFNKKVNILRHHSCCKRCSFPLEVFHVVGPFIRHHQQKRITEDDERIFFVGILEYYSVLRMRAPPRRVGLKSKTVECC